METPLTPVSQEEFFSVLSYTEHFRGRSTFGTIWYFANSKYTGERRQSLNGEYTFWLGIY